MKNMKVTSGAISSVVVTSRVYRLMLEDVELDYVDLEDVERQRLDLTRIKVNK
jgi:hypothetical protein